MLLPRVGVVAGVLFLRPDDGRLWDCKPMRAGLSLPVKIGLYCAAGVMMGASVCAWFAYGDQFQSVRGQFQTHAETVQAMTRSLVLTGDENSRPEGLRSYYRLETKRGHFDQIALVAGDRIVLAHVPEAELQEVDFGLGYEGLTERLAQQKQIDELVTTFNAEQDRWEGIIYLGRVTDTQASYLYVSLGASSARQQALAAVFRVFKIGLFLALGMAVLVYGLLKKFLHEPMVRLKNGIVSQGLQHGLFVESLGELEELAIVIDMASRTLLAGEESRRFTLKESLGKVSEQSQVQTDLLKSLVKELRTSMSAVLGHAELLLNGDPSPADRVNFIRAIQQDARRISRLSHVLQTLLPMASEKREDEADAVELPVAALRDVIEQLRGQSASLQVGTRDLSELLADDSQGDQSEPDEPGPDEFDPVENRVVERLTGSVLVVGRSQGRSRELIRQLHDIGIRAVSVPDVSAFEAELGGGEDYDLVIADWAGGPQASADRIERLRERFREGTLIALLPESYRGRGDHFLKLGCTDFLFAPVTRRGIVAVLGKYLAFRPV